MSELYDILVETPPTKVILLALDQGLWDCERSLNELAALCEANHMEAVASVTQKRQTPETGIVLGSGKLEEAAAKVSGEPTAVGDNAFWIDDANDKEHKFDTDEETIYVTVRKLVDVKGNVEWKIDDGDIDDLKDLKSDKNTTYSAKDAWVMKTVDDETASLVYIFWTETEKGDTRDITFIGSDFTVKSESATTSVDGKVATVNDKGMDAKFSIVYDAAQFDLVSVKLEDGTVLTAKDGV